MNKNNNGLILFKGRSLINDMPIVVIATGLKAVTSNKKTGDMIQTWILYDGLEPHKAFKIKNMVRQYAVTVLMRVIIIIHATLNGFMRH